MESLSSDYRLTVTSSGVRYALGTKRKTESNSASTEEDEMIWSVILWVVFALMIWSVVLAAFMRRE